MPGLSTTWAGWFQTGYIEYFNIFQITQPLAGDIVQEQSSYGVSSV